MTYGIQAIEFKGSLEMDKATFINSVAPSSSGPGGMTLNHSTPVRIWLGLLADEPHNI